MYREQKLYVCVCKKHLAKPRFDRLFLTFPNQENHLWIKIKVAKLLSTVGLWLTKKLVKDEYREEFIAIAEIDIVQARLLVSLDHRKAQAFLFESSHPNIAELIRLVTRAIQCLESQEKFDASLLPTTVQTVSMENFFIDQNGKYIDSYRKTADFKAQALKFLRLYFSIENVDYGVMNFNRRVLKVVVQQCVNTAQMLGKFSYEE